MPSQERQAVLAVDWPGIMTNVDPRDVPEGAAVEQVNACSITVGQLTVRKGLQPVTFEDD